MPDLAYWHGTRVNRVPEATLSFEIPDQTPADNLNGPVKAAAICPNLHRADRRGGRHQGDAGQRGWHGKLRDVLHAFSGVASELGFKPKICMAPGLTGQRPGDPPNPVIAALVPFLKRQRARMLVSIGGDPNSKKQPISGCHDRMW